MIKVFKTKDFEAVNEFIKDVDVKENGLLFTDENIIVTYEPKENYKKDYLTMIIASIKKNRFHSEVALTSRKIELELAEQKYLLEPNTKKLEELCNTKKEAVKTAEENIMVADQQLQVYEQQLKELN